MNRVASISTTRTSRARTRPTRLALGLGLAASAALILTACASTTPGSAGSPEGTWGDAASANTPYLELGDDGRLTGTDGCNRLTGTWKVAGDEITFGPLASTRMACEGVDTWLSNAVSAKISGSTMTVTGSGGAEIGSLERTA